MNFTTSIPAELFERLDEYSKLFKMPKSRILENALNSYFEKIKKAEYIRSFRNAAEDRDMSSIAEEGLEDYLKILEPDETA
jgi:hypothetical protein